LLIKLLIVADCWVIESLIYSFINNILTVNRKAYGSRCFL
jgi:hypothetical protein